MRMLCDLRICQPPEGAVGFSFYVANTLESGTAERRILCKQEVAAPKPLAGDRAVRLSVNRKEDAGAFVGLRDALHQHKDVPIWISVDRSGTQRLARQRHGIEIGVVVGVCRAPLARVHAVRNRPPQIVLEARNEAVRPGGRPVSGPRGGRISE